jgi:mono/diheme cytochrome c family protein
MKLTSWVAAACAVAYPFAASADGGDISVERGRQVSIIGGCNDCHTAGYNESGGKIDPSKALAGIPVGWQGPWGTTYAVNIRLYVKDMSEDDFVKDAKSFTAEPPMPFYNVHAMDESDLRSLYRYIKSLGEPGAPMPEALPPGVEPKTPYIVMAPPVMPKG